MNVIGAAAFAVGSVLFLDHALARLGIGLFVLGSLGMLFGALAVWLERYAPPRRRRTDDASGAVPAPATAVPTPASAAQAAPGPASHD